MLDVLNVRLKLVMLMMLLVSVENVCLWLKWFIVLFTANVRVHDKADKHHFKMISYNKP